MKPGDAKRKSGDAKRPVNAKIRLGRAGEMWAEEYLLQKGYRIAERNFRTREGEIDRIVWDGDTLVFVEIKTRRSTRFGTPLEAVTRKKQQTIRATALVYLQGSGRKCESFRFDVISILYHGQSVDPDVEHVIGAF